MREILFRGKRVDNGEWLYGWYEMYPFARFPVRSCIIPRENAKGGCYEHVEVDPATVGEYTGLQDKNGNKIFDGDIISAPYWRGRKVEMMKGLIEFSKGAFSVVWQDTMYGKHFAGYVADMEVIGNIFDNPELWEE